MSTTIPVMDETDVEQQLRARITEQANMIAVALAYIRAGLPGIAALVLANIETTKEP